MIDKTTYVDVIEVAKFYSVSTSTVRGWIRNKQIPASAYLKLGSTYRFRLADVDAALRAPPPNPVPVAETRDPSAPVQLELNFDADKDI